MAIKKRNVKKPVQPSNLSPTSLDVLRAKVKHYLPQKTLVHPRVVSWEELKKSNPWLDALENEAKSIFNVRDIPHLDRLAEELVQLPK